jgi:type IV secretory pathway VirB2 component (pilin)
MHPFFSLSTSNAITSSAAWVHGTLVGTVGTAIAVIAIASIGLLMSSGRLDVRRGAHAILGCFIIFGASTIASGIVGALAGAATSRDVAQAPTPPPALPAAPAYPNANPSAFDPYAGAAVPSQ